MRKLIFALLFLTTGKISAQQFIQEFRTGRDDVGTAVRQDDNRDYLMANYRFGPGIINAGGINLTKMSDLGRQRWSRDYDFNFPVGIPDLAYWPEQAGYLVSTMAAVDSVRDKIVARITADGTPVWMYRLGAASPVQLENAGRTKILPVSNSEFVVAAGAGRFASNTGENDLMLAKLDADGNLLWSHNYCFSCLGNYETLLGDLLQTSDGGFLISGGLYYTDSLGVQQEALLLKTDSDGQVSWTKSYAVDSSSTPTPALTAWNLAEPKPGQYVLTGTYSDFINSDDDGFLITVSDTGAVQVSNRWNVTGGNFEIYTFDLVVRDTGSVVMAGSTTEDTIPSLGREYNFLAAVSTDTLMETIWAKNYFQELNVGILTPYHALVNTTDGGYAYFISIDTVFVNSNAVLVKTNDAGETGCEKDLTLRTDTLPLRAIDWTIPVQTLSDIDTIELKEEKSFDDITPTMEGLELIGGGAFCEPLAVPLDATVKEAETYAWSTGESTPTIVATKEGLYTVQVSSVALCFTLPDTTSINIIPPPMGFIIANPDSMCAENKVLLYANGQGAASYLWSTGATTPEIIVDARGTYTVTLTNPCGSTTISTEVTRVGCICDIVFPNAFTPNSDQTNDTFQPAFPCGNFTDYHLYVYNRWGENVFETTSQTEGWNGENNGQPAPVDVYAWYASYKTPEGEIVTQKGDVTLLR